METTQDWTVHTFTNSVKQKYQINLAKCAEHEKEMIIKHSSKLSANRRTLLE